MHVDIEALNQQIYVESAFVDKLKESTSKCIIGRFTRFSKNFGD